MRIRNFPFAVRIAFYTLPVLVIILLLGTGEQAFVARHSPLALAGPSRNGPVSQAFARAASEFHVPAVLLKAICYMEGRLSNNGGWPSRDNGFGCMHLVKNDHVDMLDRAARELGERAPTQTGHANQYSRRCYPLARLRAATLTHAQPARQPERLVWSCSRV